MEDPLPKSRRIGYNDLVEHGFAEGCAQCEHNDVFSRSKDGPSHTAACRAPFTRTDSSDNRTIADADQRIGDESGRDCHQGLSITLVGFSHEEIEDPYPVSRSPTTSR